MCWPIQWGEKTPQAEVGSLTVAFFSKEGEVLSSDGDAMIRTFFLIVTIAQLLVSATDAQACSGCGRAGGPGYRGPDKKCLREAADNEIYSRTGQFSLPD